MTNVNFIWKQLPELYPELAAQRQLDPILNEICCDYEELSAITNSSEINADQKDDTLHEDLHDTLRALQEEIGLKLEDLND